MKNKLTFFIIFFITILFSNNANSQTVHPDMSSEFEPVYITVTTLHGEGGGDIKEWKAIEQEYFDKVTSKINILISHEVLISNIKNDFSDIKIINVFKSWDDIQKMNNIRQDLVEKAWPDEDERNEFFEKQNSYYTNYHSDEIYTSTRYGFKISDKVRNSQKEPFVFYIQTSTLSDNSDEDSYNDYKKYVDNVFKKNPYVKGYYTQRHHWGADSRDFVEMFVLSSADDVKKLIDKNKELLKKFEPNDKKRNDFIEVYNKGIESRSIEIFVNVPSLSK